MKKLNFFSLTFFFCIFSISLVQAQCPLDCRYLYVDGAVGASGAGTAWATAFKNLQEAIDAANTMTPADTIIVKAGTYKPDNGTDRTKSFIINGKEVYIYGGYTGTELETATGGLIPQANPTVNITILSGDLGVINTVADNSYHVVQIENTTKGKMQGLTIADGSAEGAAAKDKNGGGIWAGTNTVFDLESVRITNNFALKNGGGMYVSAGAQIYSRYMGDGYKTANSFGIDNNFATEFGGGIYYEAGSKLKSEIIYFGNNFANLGGGGVYIGAGSQIVGIFVDFVFVANQTVTLGSKGGGMMIVGDIGNAIILEATFKNNISAGSGAALYVAGTSSNLELLNMIFISNISFNTGGAVSVFDCNNLKLQHFTLKGNIANNANSGGGILIDNQNNNRTVDIQNCLFWENKSNNVNNSVTVINKGATNPAATNCLFQEATCPTDVTCNAVCIYNTDPQFLTGYAEDVMIVPASPAAEAGVNLSPIVVNDRFAYVRSCIPDIGAVEVQRLWTGGVGNLSTSAGIGNWKVATNWTPQSLLPLPVTYSIPSGTYTAMIQSGEVTIDADQSAHAVYLEGGKLTISNNATLSIKRIFRRSANITFAGGGGTFESGEGTENVIFENDCNAAPYNLTNRNTIVLGRLNFNYLTVNNAQHLQVGSSEFIAVKRLLTLQTGHFFISNNLALLSTANYTAMLINNAFEIRGTNQPANDNRNVVVQRYVTPYSPRPTGLGYTYFSSPVVGARVSNFSSAMNLVLDNGANPYYWFNLFYTVANFPTFYKYVEGENNIFEGGASPQAGWRCPAINETLEVGRGYIANLNSGVTVNLSGFLNNEGLSIPVTRGGAANSGFNLIGNPYPSPINWDAVYNLGSNNTLVTPFIWRRIATGQYTGIFDYYQAGSPIGTNGGTKGVQSSQGFFVRANAGGNITMDNSVRVTGGYVNPQFFRTEENKTELEGFIRIQLKNSQIADGTILTFNAKASEKIEANFDMEKIQLNSSIAPNFYTKNEGKRIAINGLPPLTEEKIIPLFFMTFESGQHTISASHVTNFKENVMVILEDKTLGILHDLQAKPYTFTTNANGGAENNRFQLRLMPNVSFSLEEWANISVFPNPAQNELQIKLLSKKEGNLQVTIYDALGRKVLAQEIEKTRDIMEGKFDISDLKQGIYIIELIQGTNKMSKKILKQ